MSVCASRESENLIVLQIELKIFFITALHHAGQCLKIFDRLTIESKNLKGREQQYLSRELEWTKIRLKKKNTKNVSSDLCINNVFISYINVGYKYLRTIQNTYKPLKKDEQKNKQKITWGRTWETTTTCSSTDCAIACRCLSNSFTGASNSYSFPYWKSVKPRV